jgi:hypothetical protein
MLAFGKPTTETRPPRLTLFGSTLRCSKRLDPLRDAELEDAVGCQRL